MNVPDAELDDLRERLLRTRWAAGWGTPAWAAGTDGDELRRLVAYWASGYDWRTHETSINALPSHFAEIAGTPVHYLRFDAERAGGRLPLLLSNGWPSSFLEMIELARRLSVPSQYGGDPNDSFTVIVPSLPGFGFSPQRPGFGDAEPTHELWHQLMHEELGFARYGAHGADLGAEITIRLGQAHPEAVAGIHVLGVGNPPSFDPATLTDDERAYLDATRSGSPPRADTRTNSAPARSRSRRVCPTHRPGCWPGSWRSTGPGATAAVTSPPGSATTSCSPRPRCTGSPTPSRRRSARTTNELCCPRSARSMCLPR